MRPFRACSLKSSSLHKSMDDWSCIHPEAVCEALWSSENPVASSLKPMCCFSSPLPCLRSNNIRTGENWSVEVSLHFRVVAVVDLEHLLKEILFPWSSLLYLRWSGHCVIEIRQFPAQRQSGHTKKHSKRRLELSYMVWWRFKESLPERQSQHTASF